MRYIVLSILTVYSQYAFAEFTVRTVQGYVEGIVLPTRKGKSFLAFENIPYAEPPVGELRFRNPIPKRPSKTVLKANRQSKQCIQKNNIGEVVGDEDCLYLNVYTPLDHDSSKGLLPVMVYVHGGTYTSENGSRTAYGPEHLLDKDIILVMMNYRLGVLGFLSTGDLALPGNFGMKDQALSLKWVQQNIKQFGGDRNRVTLFGESAGSGSVALHTLSDLSKDLYHQYIVQSGVAFNPWSVQRIPRYYEDPKTIARNNNCPTENSYLLAECLRQLTPEQLLNISFPPCKVLVCSEIEWRPTIEPESEGAFITKDPLKLIREKKAKDCPFISGTVKDEGLSISMGLYLYEEIFQRYMNNLDVAISEFLQYTDWEEYENVTALVEDIKEFYFSDEVLNSKEAFRENFTNLFGDFIFNYAQDVHLQYSRKFNTKPIYSYNFRFQGRKSHTMIDSKDFRTFGVSHADELIYLFAINNAKFNLPQTVKTTPNEEAITDLLVDLWTSFAATGVPSSNHLEDPFLWEPYVPNKRVLLIGNSTEPSTSLGYASNVERMDFWHKHLPK